MRCLSTWLLHRFPLRNAWLATRALRWAEHYKKKKKKKDHLSVCCEISSHREKYAVGVSNQRVRSLECDYEAVFASVTSWWYCLRSSSLISDMITDLLLNWLTQKLKKKKSKQSMKKAGFESLNNSFLVGFFRSCRTASGMIRGLCWHFISHSAVNGVLPDWNNRIVSWFIHESEREPAQLCRSASPLEWSGGSLTVSMPEPTTHWHQQLYCFLNGECIACMSDIPNLLDEHTHQKAIRKHRGSHLSNGQFGRRPS